VQRLSNCKIETEIVEIEGISGADQYFEIEVLDSDGRRSKLVFDFVWDMSYYHHGDTQERVHSLLQGSEKGLARSSIYVVEESNYIEYFKDQVSGTRPTDKLTHYLVIDALGASVDILTIIEPVLLKLDVEDAV